MCATTSAPTSEAAPSASSTTSSRRVQTESSAWIVNSTFGGAIYNDGNEIVLNITSSLIENDKANEGGSAVFFVSNNKTGSITAKDSITRNNPAAPSKHRAFLASTSSRSSLLRSSIRRS